MYIITNTTSTGEYTPSKAETYLEAYDWMVECTADNIASAYDGEDNWVDDMTEEEIIEWAKENVDGFEFSEYHSRVEYTDDSFNEMNIYELDTL